MFSGICIISLLTHAALAIDVGRTLDDFVGAGSTFQSWSGQLYGVSNMLLSFVRI
jgi:hypothetical protein